MSQRAPSRGTGRPWRGRGSTRLMTGKLDLSQAPDHLWRRLYICGVDDDLEKLHGYRPGAYCPVHLHDELHDGQYRVIHKLGHGGYATVWLCQDQHSDTPSYVAIKIIVANETGKDSRELLLAAQMNQEGIDQIPARRNLCLPLKQFTSQSPNGTHTCLVYPVLGPMVRHARDIFEEEDNTVEMLQNVSRQVVEALAFLHSCGICHAGTLGILARLFSLRSLIKYGRFPTLEYSSWATGSWWPRRGASVLNSRRPRNNRRQHSK